MSVLSFCVLHVAHIWYRMAYIQTHSTLHCTSCIIFGHYEKRFSTKLHHLHCNWKIKYKLDLHQGHVSKQNSYHYLRLSPAQNTLNSAESWPETPNIQTFIVNWMNGYTEPGTTWADDMYFGMLQTKIDHSRCCTEGIYKSIL